MITRGKIVVITVTTVVGLALAGCAPTPAPVDPAPSDPPASAAPTPTPSPTPEGPDPEAIRDVDFATLAWTWDTQGTVFDVQMTGPVTQAQDAYYQDTATFSLGDITYGDANDDGLTDAAVEMIWESGNGIAEGWFVWLAQADAPESPQQVPSAIAWGARCGDAVSGVEAIDGGFRVTEVMRSSIEAGGPCAESGTMTRTRDVGVVGDGTGAGSWPATLDGQGWGGYCPVKVITEGAFHEAFGFVGPSLDAPETTATGEKLFSPLQPYPFHQPEGWVLTGFLPDAPVDDSVVCVWVQRQG